MEDGTVEVGASIRGPRTVPPCSCWAALRQTQVPWGAARPPCPRGPGGWGGWWRTSAHPSSSGGGAERQSVALPDDVDVVTLI